MAAGEILKATVRVALHDIADDIFDELDTTPNHDKRLRIARDIAQNDGGYVGHIFWAAQGPPYVLSDVSSYTDVKTAVTTLLVNMVKGGLGG